ncbi:MAG: hypothetical protein LRY55_01725 [Leadbetterella sp.]|nr:hypothetical protein [Leadbetterella sp.]
MNRIFLTLLLLPALFSCKDKEKDQPVEVNGKLTLWTTTGSQAKLLAKDSISLIQKQESNPGITITAEEQETLQEIEGFGAALTESSSLPHAHKTKCLPAKRAYPGALHP